MSDIAIRVQNLSKQYKIVSSRQRHDTLRDQIMDSLRSAFRRNGQPNGRAETIWALKDVSLEVKQGEVVGIIGRNGAGKSTLLKILSRITPPTTGRAELYGRVGSLLEVGIGFDPELSGRENIYLNGAILGMKKAELDRKFDEIVAFSEVEKFIDTPVKRYSSGMYVRLAFAVAAHLDPEILIVDEVLAVGDIQFQKKCLGKMHDISANQGRTVLFVSHNMDAIQRLCPMCMMLEGGQLTQYDNTASIIARYLSSNSCKASPNHWIDVSAMSRTGTGKARFVRVRYSSLNEVTGYQPYSCGPLEFLLDIVSDSHKTLGSIAATLYDLSGVKLVNADSVLQGQIITLQKGLNTVKLRIKNLYLNPGAYRVGLWLADPISEKSPGAEYDHVQSAFTVEVVRQKSEIRQLGMTPTHDGVVTCEIDLLEAQ